jgi:hypothetical protein
MIRDRSGFACDAVVTHFAALSGALCAHHRDAVDSSLDSGRVIEGGRMQVGIIRKAPRMIDRELKTTTSQAPEF